MNILCYKVLAYGSSKRFAYLCVNGVNFCIRISSDLYILLRDSGVPTAQKLRFYGRNKN